jgi:hypothetical protein
MWFQMTICNGSLQNLPKVCMLSQKEICSWKSYTSKTYFLEQLSQNWYRVYYAHEHINFFCM